MHVAGLCNLFNCITEHIANYYSYVRNLLYVVGLKPIVHQAILRENVPRLDTQLAITSLPEREKLQRSCVACKTIVN